MKEILLFIYTFLFAVAFAQPMPLELASNKTTSVVFPFSIAHVDLGSKDIFAQQVVEAPNVLQLKAAVDSFTATNVSVITADGALYLFDVSFNAAPGQLCIVLQKNTPVADIKNNEADFLKAVVVASNKRRNCFSVSDRHDKIDGVLHGLYIKKDVLYFDIKISNASAVSYTVDALHCTIKDKQKGKRTATQELPLQPTFTHGLTTAIPGNAAGHLFLAFPAFTLPDKMYLSLHITEQNGGRDILLRIHNRQLLQAKTLHDAD